MPYTAHLLAVSALAMKVAEIAAQIGERLSDVIEALSADAVRAHLENSIAAIYEFFQ